jgi:hypothetical protein
VTSRSSKGDASVRTPRAAEFAPTSPRGLSKEEDLTSKNVSGQGFGEKHGKSTSRVLAFCALFGMDGVLMQDGSNSRWHISSQTTDRECAEESPDKFALHRGAW